MFHKERKNMKSYEEFVETLIIEYPEYPDMINNIDYLKSAYADYVEAYEYDNRDLI